MLAPLATCCLLLAPQQGPDSADAKGPRTARIGRIETDAAPTVDGRLDDACWTGAPELGALVEVEPRIGAKPGQDTRVRIVHDRRALYIAVECFDDNPAGIRATQRARDARLDPDDRVEFFIDPFQSRRNAIWFQVGAGGSRGEALIGDQFERSWDTIWYAKTRVTKRGWQLEVEIPFRSIPFPAAVDTWGFNLRRLRRQNNADYRWTNIRQGGRFFFRVAESGRLTGFGDTHIGVGIDVVPYVALQASRSRLTDADWRDDPDAGGDVFYRITPSLTLAATAYTDFAETENDERQINLTRFPLFFPEKRDFFLEDSSRFTFGPSSSRDRSFLAFFSRRIGLDGDGNKIPLLAGVKVAGRAGPWEIGFLDTQMDSIETVSDKNLAVLRARYSLGDETTVGVIATNGRPTEVGENSTFGADFYHRVPQFIGDQDLRVWLFSMGSTTSGPGGDGGIAGFTARGDGTEWNWRYETRLTSDNFNPELGFIRRHGVFEHSGDLSFAPRPNSDVIRSYDFGVTPSLVLDTSNDVEELEVEVDYLGINFQSGDEIGLDFERSFERVPEDFDVFGNNTIRAGDYWESRLGARLETSDGRPVSGRAFASTGDFFDGESHRISGRAAWRPVPLLTIGGELTWNKVNLPANNFTAVIGETTVDLDFSPDLSLRNLVQYDNESENIGFQSRLRWVIQPGSDVFVVLAGDWQRATTSRSFVPDNQDATIKFVHTLRF